MTAISSQPPVLIQSTPKDIKFRLSIMMFLQYAIWGAWLPLFFSFLTEHRGLSPWQAGELFSIGAIGALVAPFVSGQIADRWFNTEKFLGISHLIGAVLVWQIAGATSWSSLIVYSVLYSLIYAPTLALTNALAFHHLVDRDRDFGKVRVWGTIGWIVVGLGIGQWLYHTYTIPAEPIRTALVAPGATRTPDALADTIRQNMVKKGWQDNADTADLSKRAAIAAQAVPVATPEVGAAVAVRRVQVAGMGDSLRLSAIIGVIMGIYCFMLPKTPPQRGKQQFAPFEALAEVKKRPLFLLFLIAFPISCVHQFYFVNTAGFLGTLRVGAADMINAVFGVGGGGLMTIGQMSELCVLAIIPLFIKSFSKKTFLLIGVAAYIVRFAVFAYLPTAWAVIPALMLHGVCFGCFFFISFMLVDELTTKDVRASAQGLFNLVVVGFGVIVGNIFAGTVAQSSLHGTVMDYRRLFSVPMWVCVVCFALLAIAYPNRARTAATE